MSAPTIPRSFIPGSTLPQPLSLLLFLNGFLQTLVQPSLTSLLTLSPMAVDLSKLSVVYSLLYVPYLLKPTYARVLIYFESLYSRPLLPFLLPFTYLLQSLSLLLLTTVVDLEGTEGLAWFTTVNWTRELTLAAGDWMLTIAVIRHLRKEGTCTTATINSSMAESSRLRYLGSFLGSLLTILVYAAIGDNGDVGGVPKGVMVFCFMIASGVSAGGGIWAGSVYRDDRNSIKKGEAERTMLKGRGVGGNDNGRGDGWTQVKVGFLQVLLLLTLIPNYPTWLTAVLVVPVLAASNVSDRNLLAYTIAPNLGYAATGVLYQVYSENVWFLLTMPCAGMLVSTWGAKYYRGLKISTISGLWAYLALFTLSDSLAGEGVGYVRAIDTYCLNVTSTTETEGTCNDDCYGRECGYVSDTAYAWIVGLFFTAVKGVVGELAFLPIIGLATRRIINEKDGEGEGGTEDDRGRGEDDTREEEDDQSLLVTQQSQDSSDVYKYTISYTLTVDVGNIISDLLTPLYIARVCALMGGTEDTIKPVHYIAWGLVGGAAYRLTVCAIGWKRGKVERRGKEEESAGRSLEGEGSVI